MINKSMYPHFTMTRTRTKVHDRQPSQSITQLRMYCDVVPLYDTELCVQSSPEKGIRIVA
jgi:hypothetical protein